MKKTPYIGIKAYTGPQLDEKSEVVFLPNAQKNEAMRYVKAWRLSEAGERALLGNCSPEVVATYLWYWPLHAENEPRLIKRKDSSLIRLYVKRFPLGKDAQVLFANQGSKDDLNYFLKESPYPLFGDTITALNNRGYALPPYTF